MLHARPLQAEGGRSNGSPRKEAGESGKRQALHRHASTEAPEQRLETKAQSAGDQMRSIIHREGRTSGPVGKFTLPLIVRHKIFVLGEEKQRFADVGAQPADELIREGAVSRILTYHTDRTVLQIQIARKPA